ncbi:DUF3801 domain-containing protein [Actinomyces sp. 594]|uniref:DUF3801 domain-containing protein n=1 Tax=Actinomyces sp. 594 TaxID=2057793 RepID=UPI001C5A0F79|nr:DUF3801 domain-containing protein [Actinomyces sp. 594]MBW3069623.1 DUF3801 domain-containing protein [Actinomyces sp. 594]
MEMIDSASEEAKQVAVRTTGAGARTTIHFAVKVTSIAAHLGGGAAINALRSMRDAARQALHEQRTTGKITVREFGRTITGNREVADITDQAVARELEKTLKRYGVTFAVERGSGTRTFHVQGKDISVVEHALSVASERIDRQIARNATRRRNAKKIENRAARTTQQRQQRERKQYRSVPVPSVPVPKDAEQDRPARSAR